MRFSGLLPAPGSRLSATESPEASGIETSRGPSRRPRAKSRELLVLLSLLSLATACVGDRDRLAPPRLTMELLDSIVRPGALISVRLVAVDRNSDLASIAARAVAADSAYVQRQDLFGGLDSVEVVYGIRVAATAQDGDPVQVTGSVINEQLLSRDTTAFAVVRIPPP